MINLPDLDSPTLEEEMAEILKSDREQLMQLCLLIESFNWHEKMAVGLAAYHQIDPTHTQLFRLTPAHGELSVPLNQAIEFVQKLSPQALAELAADILLEDFELQELTDV
ncbi:MAG: hypothetical protein EAZ18_13040 [Oscillatoriales cyanobacterium]|nr:MAG: hypothetical protein EAZ18_13040 [Oscillatoriales cyanobacterium]